MLCVNQLAFSYRKPQKQLVDVSLNIAEGEILGLLGPNGAGKTTLVGLITGQLTPTSGSVHFNTKPVYLGHPDIALVPQEYAFYPRLSVRENLAYFAGVLKLATPQKRQRIIHALARCELSEVEHRRAGQLSGGFKRRLNFAIALLQSPKLLILDEPTANVDPHSRAFLLNTLRELNAEGSAIIYTSHLLSEVETLAHKVAVMNEGRIQLQGQLTDLLSEQLQSISLKLNTNPSAALISELAAQQQAGDWWELNLAASQLSPATALSRLEAAGITVQQIRYGQRRLEEVYLNCISGLKEHP
ncbi:ABC transporter ATP-binding protein [Gilvimarinus polysaccharolyticus]|uniref:ABC transporter ATP-binding protein n=1 Tax=Gilvimarinus polysaccharolyticus TaxID=863921 RepID=UPI000673AA1C|nr:ABC transporter ATP-binding protein [Gilvimarinus polysaccharolyticus]